MFPYIIFLNFLWKEELCFFVHEIKTMRIYVSRKRSSKDSGENYKVTYKHANNNVVPCLLLPVSSRKEADIKRGSRWMEVGGGRKRRQVFVMFCLFWLAWLTDIFEFLFSRNMYLSFLSSLQFNSFIVGFHDHFKNIYTDTIEK